jgi:hypothetical protein
MNSDRYVNDVLNPFFNQLTAEERLWVFSAHTANATMVATREVFED